MEQIGDFAVVGKDSHIRKLSLQAGSQGQLSGREARVLSLGYNMLLAQSGVLDPDIFFFSDSKERTYFSPSEFWMFKFVSYVLL